MNQPPELPPDIVEKRLQVVAQCRVIVHLATALALIHALTMETPGDILNGMDAAIEDDKWMDPIFDRAHKTWPQEFGRCPHCGAQYHDITAN